MSHPAFSRLVLAAALLAAAGCAHAPGLPGPTVKVGGGFDAAGRSTTQLAVKLRGRALPAAGRVVARLPQIGWAVVEPGTAPTDARARLAADPAVAAVAPVVAAEPEGDLGDPRLAEQAHLAIGHALDAWAIERGNPALKLAIIDTGIDMKHPDLAAKLDADSWNVFDHTRVPHDHYGHGTHTAGIAAAIAGNGEGGAGVAPGVGLMAVKVLANGDQKGTDATVAEGVLWAADHGARVMSLSLGFYKRSQVLEAALKYAFDRDVVIVASAGNQESENHPEKAPHLPSTYPGVIEVAATDDLDRKAKFSNFGPTVSVAAPGVQVLSTLPTYADAWTTEVAYGRLSGTSMAAPYVAGVAALVRSRFPAMKGPAVKAAIEAAAQDLGAPGFDPIFGHGRVDAGRALAQALRSSRSQ